MAKSAAEKSGINWRLFGLPWMVVCLTISGMAGYLAWHADKVFTNWIALWGFRVVASGLALALLVLSIEFATWVFGKRKDVE